MFIPVGFAHGFVTLESNTEVVYKVSDYYAPQHERGILWNDPALAIDWGIGGGAAGGAEPILSEKDRKNQKLAEVKDLF